MPVRLRLVGWNVQPVLMADDGDELVAVPVTSHYIPASDWEQFKHGGDEEALEILRKQVEDGDGDPAAGPRPDA